MNKEYIKNKIKINNEKIRSLTQENKNLEMELKTIETGICIGNVVKLGDKLGVISCFDSGYFKAKIIKKDGNIGKVEQYVYGRSELLYYSYKEYKAELNKL